VFGILPKKEEDRVVSDPVFPTQSSVLAAAALTERVLPEYDLPPPVRCRLTSRGLNDTYRVETANGPLYLRVYRHGWRTDAETAAELALMSDLHLHAVPVSRPMPRKDGSLFGLVRAAEGERQVALFTPAPGADVREIEPRHARAYGRLAARLHATVDDDLPTYARFHLDERHLLDEPLTAIRTRMGDVDGCAEDLAYLEEIGARVRNELMALPRTSPAYGLCHGDLHPGNVRFGDDGELTLFDFDCCGYGWRAYDLAVFLWNSYLERRSKTWRASRWRAFLRGYGAVRVLTADDLAPVPLFLVARQIWLMGLDCRGQSDWLPQWLTPEWFHSMVKYVRGWVQEYPMLTDLATP
jgi:Ser/Thr protein kinase RdoA (MazF antagonist)